MNLSSAWSESKTFPRTQLKGKTTAYKQNKNDVVIFQLKLSLYLRLEAEIPPLFLSSWQKPYQLTYRCFCVSKMLSTETNLERKSRLSLWRGNSIHAKKYIFLKRLLYRTIVLFCFVSIRCPWARYEWGSNIKLSLIPHPVAIFDPSPDILHQKVLSPRFVWLNHRCPSTPLYFR